MTVADLAIIGVMVLSGVLALMRGFTREVFSIISWAGAAFLTLWLFPPLTKTGRHVFGFIHSDVWKDVVTALIIFLIALVALSYVTMQATNKIRGGEDPGPWDGTAGFLFGIVRGFLLVAIVYLFYGWVVQPKADPQWIAHSKFIGLIKKTDTAFEKLASKAEKKIPQNTVNAKRTWF